MNDIHYHYSVIIISNNMFYERFMMIDLTPVCNINAIGIINDNNSGNLSIEGNNTRTSER